MLPILIGAGVVLLGGAFLQGCGAQPEPRRRRDAGAEPPPHTDSSLPSPTNNPPRISPLGPQTINREQSSSFTVAATDPDGDNIRLEMVEGPPNSRFTQIENRPGLARGEFSWAPGCARSLGSYTARFSAVDSRGPGYGVDSRQVDITKKFIFHYT